MNDLIVDVKLWGESVGSLYWEKESNAALFDYERKFIRSGLAVVVGVQAQRAALQLVHDIGRGRVHGVHKAVRQCAGLR